MIINIAGTNGSGKSTVVRRLIERAEHSMVIQGEGKWKEFGRIVHLPGADTNTFILGRYDSWDTGGADTIKDVELMFRLIVDYALKMNVVFEGSYAMNHTRGITLVRSGVAPVHVLRLTTTLDECKAAINERRARRGDEPFNRDWVHVKGLDVKARNFAQKLKYAGATVHRVTRDEAPACLIQLLGASGDKS